MSSTGVVPGRAPPNGAPPAGSQATARTHAWLQKNEVAPYSFKRAVNERKAYQEALAGRLYEKHQAAFALLEHASFSPPGSRPTSPPRTELPAPPVSLPPLSAAVEQAGATDGGEGGGEGTSEADPTDLKSGLGEGGQSEGDLNQIMQEQLARLRSSWSQEGSWQGPQ